MDFILGQATVKRRKKSTAAPNPKKMFEESQMVRRVKAYLNNLRVESDEVKLHEMSLECEPAASIGTAGVGIPRPKRHASPAPSTTSSTSSASDERKPTAKFGNHIFYLKKLKINIFKILAQLQVFNKKHILIFLKTRKHCNIIQFLMIDF